MFSMLANRYVDMCQLPTWESYPGELVRAQTHKIMMESSLDTILKCGHSRFISWELGYIRRFNLKFGQIPSSAHKNAREHTMHMLQVRTLKNLKLSLDFQLKMNSLNSMPCPMHSTLKTSPQWETQHKQTPFLLEWMLPRPHENKRSKSKQTMQAGMKSRSSMFNQSKSTFKEVEKFAWVNVSSFSIGSGRQL